VSPFSRKYQRFLEGSLAAFEAEEGERFSEYIQSIEGEAIEGGNAEWNVLKHNPIVFGESPFFSMDLGSLSRLAFQVADDPFYKSLKSKFYPEVILVNLRGQVKARVGPSHTSSSSSTSYTKKGHGLPALSYEDDIREAKLKVNDDRRVNINLAALMSKGAGSRSGSALTDGGQARMKGKMLLLTVKASEEMRGKKDSAGEFDRAWYRLVNADTSQTLEYKKLKEINGPDSLNNTSEEGTGEDGEEGTASKFSETYQTYVAGRLYLDS
jgi:hypothetical protein